MIKKIAVGLVGIILGIGLAFIQQPLATGTSFGGGASTGFGNTGGGGSPFGIATTSPFGRLSIEQDTETSSFWVGNTGSSTPSFTILGVNGNGRIGIGTASPTGALTINTANSVTDPMLDLKNGATNIFSFIRTSDVNAQFNIINLNSMQVSTNQLIFSNDAGLTSTLFRVGGADAMLLNSTGLGIGSTSPFKKLSVTGTVAFDGLTSAAGTPSSICMNAASKEITLNAALTCTVSARDQKNSINQLSVSGIEVLKKLNPVSFKYNDSNRLRWGFIADELQSVSHQLGDGYNEKDEARSIDVPGLISISAKAIQELIVQNEQFEKRIKVLENK